MFITNCNREKQRRYSDGAKKDIPQGLKPISFSGFIGTTKVVP
jgi:hypothetical protein